MIFSEQPVKQLLIDLDGTLLGNRQFHVSFAFAKHALSTLKPYGGWRKAARTLLAINREFTRPSPDATNDVRVVNLFSKRMGVDLDEARKILRTSLSEIFPGLKRHFYPVPGAKEFLEWAKDRYPMILATNPVWPPDIVEMRVLWAGIDPKLFSSVTHARRMHACKPTREYYQEILGQENLKAEDCLLIGDDKSMDLPATRVGIRVFIVGPYKNLTRLDLRGAKAQAWRGSFKALQSELNNATPNL